jgi:hypothetical protein
MTNETLNKSSFPPFDGLRINCPSDKRESSETNTPRSGQQLGFGTLRGNDAILV